MFPSMGRKRSEFYLHCGAFQFDDYLIFYRPIETGIEVLRVVSGYRDLDALFDEPNGE